MDCTKLKYYEKLYEKGIIENEPENLDSIISTLEEKQFEYFKRLETAKDESRKDEINETLNMIDLQLKELAAIKTAINAGILVEHENKPKRIIESDVQNQDNESIKLANGNSANSDKKSKKGITIAIIVLVAVVAIATVFMLSQKNANQNTTTNDVATEEEQTSDADSGAKLNLYPADSDYLKQASGGFFDIPDGVYILGLDNDSLINAGIQPGDRIISIDGREIKTSDEAYASDGKKPGDELILVVKRGDKEITAVGQYGSDSDLTATGTIEYEIEGYKCKFNYDTGQFTANW